MHDYFTLKRESLPPPLSQYVKESLEHFVQVSTAFGGEASYSYKVNGHLEVDMYSTAHVLGSQALLYKVKLVSGRVVKILMAGDIGRYDHNPL